MSELQRALGAIEGKLEHLIDTVGTQDERLRSVESKINKAAGVVAVITIIVTGSLTYIARKLGG